MVQYISARTVYPVSGPPIPNGVIGVAGDGTIHAVLTATEASDRGIQDVAYYDGVLVPGFINAHCHLELSHMHGLLPKKTGLTTFIKGVLAARNTAEAAVVSAMRDADREMYNNGIVAVGDISNQLISKEVKEESKIYYHTFIEVFGFNAPAAKTISDGLSLRHAFGPLKTSIVPHAPYSVSSALFGEISKIAADADVISIHNQETQGENELFESGTGRFADFFAELGIAQSDAHASGKNSIRYHLPQLPRDNRILLVHNTFTSKEDVSFAQNIHRSLYWCLCPSANLYIEDALPDIGMFEQAKAKLVLGTDSLASNHELNILAEMRVLQDFKQVGFERSLSWGTLHGAEFLGIDSRYGSLAEGKRPGILLIGLESDGIIRTNTSIKRLF